MARRKIEGGGEAKPAVDDRTANLFEVSATGATTSSAVEVPTVLDWPAVLECPMCKTRQQSKAAANIDKTSKRCMSCGHAMTVYNEPVEKVAKTDAGPVSIPVEISSLKEPKFSSVPPRPETVAKAVETPGGPAMFSFSKEPVDEGDEVTVTHGPELYGKPGTFSTYTVGPFTSRSRVRPGETRVEAFTRVLHDLREVATAEREKAHVEFCSHFMTKVVGGAKA